MEIIKEEHTPEVSYYTVRVNNRLIKYEKILEIIERIDDYILSNGTIDKETLKEDILEPRDYIVTIKGDNTSCTCKNCLFRKTKCRHITFVEDETKS